MPNYGYHFARAKGRAIRALYRGFVGRFAEIESARSFPLEVFSYSGEAALPEQVASIRSFLRHVGRPPRFTVVSDGTYSNESRRVLKATHPSISVSDVRDWTPANLPEEIYSYLKDHPTGRQLALIMSLARNGPVLYLDSDILFFGERMTFIPTPKRAAFRHSIWPIVVFRATNAFCAINRKQTTP